MRLIHGTDERKHDLPLLWGNRLVFVMVLLATVFMLAFFVCITISVFSDGWSIDLFLCLLIAVPGLAFSLDALFETVWSNARYCLDDQGITLAYPLKAKRYAWSCFKKVFVSPVFRSARVNASNDYIILVISNCRGLTQPLDIHKCWHYHNSFLVVRCTKTRIQEFEKYCVIHKQHLGRGQGTAPCST